MVKIYTTGPSCFKCSTTKRKLTEVGVPFEEVHFKDAPDFLEKVKAEGHTQAPVVTDMDNNILWSDLNSNTINEQIKSLVS